MSEEQTNFKVTDRRLFNPDGSARDVPREEKPEAPAAVKAAEPPASSQTETPSTPSASAESIGAEKAETAAPPQGEATDEAAADDAELVGAEDPASFANFIMSIASNAASSLGMMEHPITGKRAVDLELGKHWIDILGMLQQKTRGNLLAPEQQVLEGLLADLRMQFVSLSTATPPQARKFSGSDITGGR